MSATPMVPPAALPQVAERPNEAAPSQRPQPRRRANRGAANGGNVAPRNAAATRLAQAPNTPTSDSIDALAYRELAESISDGFDNAARQEHPPQTYASPGLVRGARGRQSRPEVDPLEATKNQAIADAQKQIKDAAAAAEQLEKEADEAMRKAFDAGGKIVGKTAEAASNGAFSVDGTTRELQGTMHGTPVYADRETHTDYGIVAMGLAGLASGKMESDAMTLRANNKILAQKKVEEGRVSAWKLLAAHLAEFYGSVPELPAGKDVFRLETEIGDPAGNPRMVLINTGDRALTHVTLLLQLVHFVSRPSPSIEQWYYFPIINAGQRVILGGNFNPTVSSDDLKRRSELGSMPDERTDWVVARVGGVLSASATFYCSQYHGGAGPFEFPENAQRAALWELDAACQECLKMMRAEDSRAHEAPVRTAPAAAAGRGRGAFAGNYPPNGYGPPVPEVPLPVMPPRTTSPRFADERKSADALVHHALEYAPPDSPDVARMHAFLSDPQAVSLEYCKGLMQSTLGRMPLETAMVGEWHVVRGAVVGVGEAAQSHRMNLTIKSVGTTDQRVVAVLIDPDFPNESRQFAGTLTRSMKEDKLRMATIGDQWVLRLVSPDSGSAKQRYSESLIDHPAHWSRIDLVIGEQQVSGVGEISGLATSIYDPKVLVNVQFSIPPKTAKSQ